MESDECFKKRVHLNDVKACESANAACDSKVFSISYATYDRNMPRPPAPKGDYVCRQPSVPEKPTTKSRFMSKSPHVWAADSQPMKKFEEAKPICKDALKKWLNLATKKEVAAYYKEKARVDAQTEEEKALEKEACKWVYLEDDVELSKKTQKSKCAAEKKRQATYKAQAKAKAKAAKSAACTASAKKNRCTLKKWDWNVYMNTHCKAECAKFKSDACTVSAQANRCDLVTWGWKTYMDNNCGAECAAFKAA